MNKKKNIERDNAIWAATCGLDQVQGLVNAVGDELAPVWELINDTKFENLSREQVTNIAWQIHRNHRTLEALIPAISTRIKETKRDMREWGGNDE